jgi:putative inorganic carbon (HCO3(-)) transporter
MTLPLFFFLAQTESPRWLKRFFAFLIVITIPAIFCTYSRGALVGLVVVSSLMFLHLKERLLLIPLIVVAILVVVLAAPEKWKERMDPTKDEVIDASAQARLNTWAFARNLAYDNPIAGGGFATFTPELFSRYAPAATAIVGAHSVYFGLLAEHGFVGLFIYLVLVFSCFASASKLVKWARIHQDDVVVKYTNMFRFSLTAFLVSGIFLGRAYFDYFFTLVACLVILKQVAYEEWAQGSLVTAETEAEAGMEDLSEWSVSHVS